MAITIFKNKAKPLRRNGLLIDPLDRQNQLKNTHGDHKPKFVHLNGKCIRSQNAYKKFNTTGPMNKSGKLIPYNEDGTSSVRFIDIHDDPVWDSRELAENPFIDIEDLNF